jgi:toxin HigB-1
MIRSFANTNTQTDCIWEGRRSKGVPPDVQNRALDKLKMLHRAKNFDDLRNPPSNRLHKLKEDRVGQFSISINIQWRICFVWKDGNAYYVEIADYHKS